MSQPVWTLSVDLQTRTATFTSGLADAAKGARSSFNDIKSGAQDMGRETSYSMMEARHGVMILGEEFGVRLPRALTSFIASLGPVGAAMETAFPFLAIILGATLLLEHLAKLREKGEQLTESQVKFGITVANVLNGLDEKLLEAGIRTDELNHDHLAALNKQLELIDHQSMNELVRAFDTVAKAADATMTQLKASWYQFGIGSAGAKAALEHFKGEYETLLAKGKNQEGSDLLAGTLKSAERVLAMQHQIIESNKAPEGDVEAYNKHQEARAELLKAGVGWTEREVTAQQTLVDTLQAQVEVEGKVNALKSAQKGEVRQKADNDIGKDADAAIRQQVEAQRKGEEEKQKLWEENYRAAVNALQENEREKIEATQKGSAARLSAIDAAIKEENSKGLQETEFYRSLLKSRTELVAQMTEEQKKLDAEAGKESAEHALRMAELAVAAKREGDQLLLAQGRLTARELLEAEKDAEQQEFQAKKQALNQELAALNQHDAEYQNRKQALNNKLEELETQHANKMRQIDDLLTKSLLATLRAFVNKMEGEFNQGFAQVIMGRQTFGRMMEQLAAQEVESGLKFALMSVESLATVQGRKRFGDARTAAADAWASAGNPITGAVEAVAAFSAVMALEKGGIVPGVEMGDVVPARLTPGETVIPKQMTERLNRAANDGDGQRGDVHVHVHHSPTIHALDSDGMDKVLTKHADKLQQHFERTVRRMNR